MIIEELTNLLVSSVEVFASLDPVFLYGLVMFSFCLAVLGFVANIAGISTYVERKFAARVQQRIGPSEVSIPLWWVFALAVGAGLALTTGLLVSFIIDLLQGQVQVVGSLLGEHAGVGSMFLYLVVLGALVIGGYLAGILLDSIVGRSGAIFISVANLFVITGIVTVLSKTLFTGLFSPALGVGAAYLLNLVIIVSVAVATVGLTYVGYKLGPRVQQLSPWDELRPFGVIQFMADGLKLITKEDIIPSDADRPLFKLAPFIVFAGSFPIWAVIPMGEGMYAANLNIGLLYIFAVAGVTVIGILLAGWASGNKWSLYGAMRSAAQIVSYELPSGITFLTVVMAMGTLNLNQIIANQSSNASPWFFDMVGLAGVPAGMLNWFVFRYPIFTIPMFIIFFVAGVAEVNRAPFDLPESESELVAGFHTEYTGMRFALFFMAEYVNMFVIGVITSILFLGGWQPPYPGYILSFMGPVGTGLEGFFWFAVKGYSFVILMMLMRWTLPRFRVDQLMHLAWKVMIPLSFINLAGIGIWMSLLG